MKKVFSLCTLVLILIASCKSQPPGQYSTTDKKAIKNFEDGKSAYTLGNYKEAEKEFLRSVERDPYFVEAWTILGYLYSDMGKKDKSIDALKKAIEAQPGFHKGGNYFTLGSIELSSGKYEDAKNHFTTYLTFPKKDTTMSRIASLDILSCDFAINAMKHPVPFNLINMGPEINTKDYEYFPTATTDDNLFLFTRNIRDMEKPDAYGQEDFFYSYRKDGKWTPALPVAGVNTALNEGAPCLSADGNILFFVACQDAYGYGEDRKGYGSCDIFFCFKSGDKWTKPQNLGTPVNSKHWETQPSFSSDGRTLYFIRGYMGGDGIKNNDIYMSEVMDDGRWSTPTRLSDKINTPGKEESVFIHPDNQTLYFSSDGHIGMGGLDLYMSKRQPNGEWGEPVNLGYPINTFNDENSLLVSGNGQLAYMASDREGGLGGLDLYYFELDKSLQPEHISYVKGKVYDKDTKKPLEASFELIDLETGKFVVRSFSNPLNGEFLVPLPPNKNYALNVSKEKYSFFSENFNLIEVPVDKPFLIDVPLVMPKVDEIISLKNVFFETAKFDLKPTSTYELDKLVAFLNLNPTIKIEVRGHTDNVGDDKSNLILSDNRAKSVMNYMLSKGISKDRLTAKGYGETMPLGDNNTPEGRAKNRRTEYKITSK
jgi:outer membrane protein OmpA-like peptidoglycan-associated protein